MKMMKKIWIPLAAGAVCLALLAGGCGKKPPHGLSKDKPVTITVWHYYNGMQKEKFDRLVEKFNNSEGKELGILVNSVSKGSVDELSQTLTDSMEKKIGSDPMPDMASLYADKAYECYSAGVAVDISQYMTEKEKGEYVQAYLEEGSFAGGGSMMLFPIAKSTEVLAVNKTDWEKFKAASGASEESFATWEGITRVSKEYYDWTDSLTEAPDDGKSFFGRDAFANYMIIGSLQLGHELFQTKDGDTVVDFDKTTMRRLWDNFYVPYVNGYFGAYGKFRSDDVKTGQLAAFVGSTSGCTYFPDAVTLEDGTTYEIEGDVYPLPNFEGTSSCAVQQGAGMMIVKSDDTREYAATAFLKWFTNLDNNIDFSLASGYLPVKKASDMESRIAKALEEEGDSRPVSISNLTTGLKIANEYRLYTTKPFHDGESARRVLNTTMADLARQNREVVLNLMEEGMTREDAVAQVTEDQVFDSWYEDTKAQLNAIVGK